MTRLALLLPLAPALLAPPPAAADDAVVGDGTPASCTEAALDAAIVQLVVGMQGPGGVLSFACGADPHVIPITSQKSLSGQVMLDGAGLVGLDAQGLSRHFLIAVDGDDGRTEATLRGLELANGFAAGDCGGAVHALAGVQLALEAVTIRNSIAGLSGGAISVDPGSAPLTVDASRFERNSAREGGAIATNVPSVIRDSVFDANAADWDEGGAIQRWGHPFQLEGSRFIANRAGRGGGCTSATRNCWCGVRASPTSTPATTGTRSMPRPASRAWPCSMRTSSATTQWAKAGRSRRGRRSMSCCAGSTPTARCAAVRSACSIRSSSRSGTRPCPATKPSWAVERLAASAVTLPRVGPPILSVEQSTFCDNTVAGGPGGDLRVSAGSGLFTGVSRSTLMGASAASGGPSLHIGAGNEAGLVASLLWTPAPDSCLAQSTAQLISGGFNLGPASACALAQAGDVDLPAFEDFALDPLSHYGGPNRSDLPRADSPAVDHRPCDSQDIFDMRLRPRGVDGNRDGEATCDSGAVERQALERPGALFRDGFESFAIPGEA